MLSKDNNPRPSDCGLGPFLVRVLFGCFRGLTHWGMQAPTGPQTRSGV